MTTYADVDDVLEKIYDIKDGVESDNRHGKEIRKILQNAYDQVMEVQNNMPEEEDEEEDEDEEEEDDE